MEDYSLRNADNFLKHLTKSLDEIHFKYIYLLSEYFSFILENIRFKNDIYLKFIIRRGVVTITNVFNLLLFYSKNLDMAYYHGQKAFYFYVEYIGQISEEQHTFLQLSSRDATMFVYKKTLFEINHEFKDKNSELNKSEKCIFDNLEKVQSIQTLFLDEIFEKYHFQPKELQQQIKFYISRMETFSQTIIHYNFSILQLENVELFIERNIKKLNLPVHLFYQIFDIFLKHYQDSILKDNKSVRFNILYLNLEECISDDFTINIKLCNKHISSLFL